MKATERPGSATSHTASNSGGDALIDEERRRHVLERRPRKERLGYSSDPGAGLGPILGKGRLFFLTLSLLAVLNSRLASRLPPWPRDGQDWRYEFFRCRRTSLQRLPAPCGAVA